MLIRRMRAKKTALVLLAVAFALAAGIFSFKRTRPPSVPKAPSPGVPKIEQPSVPTGLVPTSAQISAFVEPLNEFIRKAKPFGLAGPITAEAVTHIETNSL